MTKWIILQYLTLIITTIIFLIGLGIWFTDGAWVNGALPTHGLYHMLAGFVGSWGFYTCLYFLNHTEKKNK